MRIGLLHYSAPPVTGGVEAILAKHATLMADAGHQVTVIAGRGESFDPRIPFHRVPLVDSVQANVLSVKKQLDQGSIPHNFEALVSEISSSLDPILNRLDILIAHNVCSLHKNLALTSALRKRSEKFARPVLILWHHDLAWTAARYKQELHNGYPWNLIRQEWPGAIPVVISKFRRTELASLLGIEQPGIRVIPNGVPVTRVLGLNSQTVELVERLKLLSAAPLILLPVRITARKNIEFAIYVVDQLRHHFPNVVLLITGPPGPHNPANASYLTELRALRERLALIQQVHFLCDAIPHSLSDDVIYGLIRLSDLLLLPSYEEGFGLPILEASQVKLPIFCSDIGPLRELAGEEGHYFSPVGLPEEVASRVTAYLNASGVFLLRMRLRRFDWNFVYTEKIEPLLREAGGAV